MSTEIVEYVPRQQSIRATAAQFLGVPPDKACDLLRNVWQTSKGQPPLTDAEMFVGMSMIARFGLDPIAREIYVARDSRGKLMTIVGIDGWIKILDRTDGYDGFEQHLEFDKAGKLLYVETMIYSRQRSHPTKYRAYAEEYAKLGGFMLEKIPWHMLRVFSLRHAARLFAPVGGSVVTEEEARWMDAYAEVPEEKRQTLRDKVAAKATEYEALPQQEEEAAAEPEPASEYVRTSSAPQPPTEPRKRGRPPKAAEPAPEPKPAEEKPATTPAEEVDAIDTAQAQAMLVREYCEQLDEAQGDARVKSIIEHATANAALVPASLLKVRQWAAFGRKKSKSP